MGVDKEMTRSTQPLRKGVVRLAVALTTLVATAAAAEPSRHFVWRVTNLRAPFYLVGSLHSLTKDDYPLPDTYRHALARSERLVFEYDPRRRDALVRKFREVARYPSGLDIESEVRPTTLALLRKNLWKFGLKFDQVRHLRPWAIALRLLARRGPVGPSSARSMENYLATQARRSGKETGGLETVDEHVAFWREMIERDGENLLVYTLSRDRQVSRLFAQTREAWKRGDLAALAASNARLRRANAGIAQRLLDRRNRKWVGRIEAEMKTGKPTAIIAGAGHFSGPQSVLALLEKRGYKIEQL
ncbi:TraB/GumN family protein [soil metagenome]